MNGKIILLVLGAIVGGLIGWLTAPAPGVDIKLGGVNVEVNSDKTGGSMTASNGNGGSMQVTVGDHASFLDNRNERTILFGVIGAVIGLAVGGVADRRKRA